ncbi:MAG TPA: 5'-nucleotidase, lipoprotein e(P4) family [Thermoanaerobaculia bacterium]|jgi:acid phosphatase
MRKLLLLALFSAACAHTTTTPPFERPEHANDAPSAVVSTTGGATEPCVPGNALLNAALWVQHAAEYDAAALQTYAAARRALDAALAQKSARDAKPPAIVLDLDETALDNTAFEARAIGAGKTYDADLWKTWVAEADAKAVPGAAEFLAYAKSRGVTPFYVTNRDHPQETDSTRRNLERLGFPVSDGTVLMRGARPEWKSDKSSRRDFVASTHRVLLLLGDDLNDFADARDKSAADRDAIVQQARDAWGTRWFIVPNPMYGSWERAITGSGGTPCEQFQKKLEALHP